jgi:hypothetical protein
MILAVFTGSETVCAEPFEAIELALGSLWIDPEAAPT